MLYVLILVNYYNITYYVENVDTTNAMTNRTTPKTRFWHDYHCVYIIKSLKNEINVSIHRLYHIIVWINYIFK